MENEKPRLMKVEFKFSVKVANPPQMYGDTSYEDFFAVESCVIDTTPMYGLEKSVSSIFDEVLSGLVHAIATEANKTTQESEGKNEAE